MNIGDTNKIAFIIGERTSRDLRAVSIYVGGELITYDDNVAYVPQFIHSIECEAADLEQRNISNEYFFLNWGATTDGVSARGLLEGDHLRLNATLGNGKLIEITLSIKYVISIYREAANALRELHA
ncbi:MAG: hypothetical protein WBP13_10170 [Methylophilaceae bacterium]